MSIAVLCVSDKRAMGPAVFRMGAFSGWPLCPCCSQAACLEKPFLTSTYCRERAFSFFLCHCEPWCFYLLCSPLELGILMLRIVLYLAGRGPIRLQAISLVQIWWVCYYYRLPLSALAPESASFPGAQVSFSGMKAVAGCWAFSLLLKCLQLCFLSKNRATDVFM